MFGFSSFTQSSFSATTGGTFLASAVIASDSEFTFLSSVLKPPTSAFLASESVVSAFADKLKDAVGLVESGSNVVASGTRYAVGSALVASSSNSAAFGIRYAFGGATVVGESSVVALAVRYAILSTLISSESNAGLAAILIAQVSANIDAESGFSPKISYTTGSGALITEGSYFVANIREKWENEAIATEVWSIVEPTSENWTVTPS